MICGAYYEESTWFRDNRTPTYEEYMSVALVSVGYTFTVAEAFMSIMDSMVTKEALDWALGRPTILKASELMLRLVEDVKSHKILHASQLKEVEKLKIQVRGELLAIAAKHSALSEQLNLIDLIERLGLGYVGGNRFFEQQLRNAYVFGHLQLSSRWFLRKLHPSVCFLHKYAAYLEERMRWVINPDRVLKSSSFEILACDNVAQVAMMNTLKESFQVYMTFSEGVAALVNMFFDLARPARALACDILKRASQQSQELHELYEKSKRIIDNKNLEYPSVQIITMEQITALEQCLRLFKNTSFNFE
ncbi:hypothetical protein LWI28_028042 [Acer negundo]|uniref:Terpene synthase metal-binding domain-containing protein n=1 Tax=Acer negundo TaxID=4023 RepID=A0AAD5NGJ5_ACENE|nr:hypothetical protein LWI28_028042 [Acer negundo]